MGETSKLKAKLGMTISEKTYTLDLLKNLQKMVESQGVTNNNKQDNLNSK
jgi:hypothetical protein